MAIELQESFEINAPVEAVWQFLLSPENVASCMPGASLGEIIDEQQFIGNMKLKMGAITAKFSGKITYTEVDKDNPRIVMLAEAKDTSGGTVNGTITTQMKSLSAQQTEVLCESNIDMTGRLVQVGRGLIDGVSAQIIGKFIKNVKKLLESQAAQADESEGAEAAPQAAAPDMEEEDSINVLAVVWKAIWSKIVGLFKRSGN